MIVLWGAREGDIQVGSYEDRELQRQLKTLAIVRRELRQLSALFRHRPVVTAGELAEGFRRARRLIGTPASEVAETFAAATAAVDREVGR